MTSFLVERIVESPLNYWLVLVGDVLFLIALLAAGLFQGGGSPAAMAGAILVGFLSWGLMEYAYHRWVLHGPPSVARTSHARHHGNAHALVSTPLFVGPLLALGLRALLALVLPSGLATLTVFGLYAGYNYFGILHHIEHRGRAGLNRIGYLRHLSETHDLHHHRAAVNYGVTTTFWDRVFGTYAPTPRAQLRPGTVPPTGP